MLREKLKNYNVILASKSPRRQQFFKDLDIDFTIELIEVEEIYPKELKGAEITNFLADLKSQPFINLSEKELLITSDTIVWLDDVALGKPKNEVEAFKMLRNLSGKKHEVITSISIKNKNFQRIISDTTIVSFKDLTDQEINYYIKNYNPYDKAGAYGIQEWIGFIAIENMEGSYFNVAGLPVHKLYKELMSL
ncbi:Maf family nucleotide pyrophosphatase [uncultured Polaribacter sp.]|uniref:Maf family nucleotide pyrophosphatase n=1 Tax=uncultured Polaribacter sp. TaxID=174711 RepID=UPI002633B1BA|nr:Maf family nucleotide pyrophosphatase [uncultured Polaribacter sp.]